jgi:hypothetical protein
VVKTGAAPPWSVSRALLRDASATFRDSLLDSSVKVVERADWEPATFGLFLQWLYVYQYQEHDCYAPDFGCAGQPNSLTHQTELTSDNMVWRVKAAILAHNLGHFLGAPGFQNHAMERLLKAYRRNVPKATITPEMVRDHASHPKLELFLEDLVIQNGGDLTVLDSDLEKWADMLGLDHGFRSKFAKAMGIPLHVRQQQPLELEKYLVKED